MGEGGLEPPRPYGHWHLKPARLPFRHSPKQPGEPITRGAPLPNGTDPVTAAANTPSADQDQESDLLQFDSQNSVGPAMPAMADTMHASIAASRHAGGVTV